MKPYQRMERVGVLIQQAIADIIQFEAKDQRLKRIAIVRVQMNNDLSVAKVYFDAGRDFEEAMKALEHARGFIKARLSREIEIRQIPRLVFKPLDLWKDSSI